MDKWGLHVWVSCSTLHDDNPQIALPEDDQDVILTATLDLSTIQLLAQISDETSLDGRTMGVLAFNGALLAANIAAKDLLQTWWWVPLPFMAIATVLCLWSIFAKNTDLGPQALEFYATYGGLQAGAARLQLLVDLDAAFERNGTRVTQKGQLLRGALGILSVGLVVAALLIALDRPTKVRSHDRTAATAPAATTIAPAAYDVRQPASLQAAAPDARAGTVPGAARRPWRRHQPITGSH
jgi:hypothetical protein